MGFLDYCDQVLKTLEVALMVRGLHRSNLTVEELCTKLKAEGKVVVSVLQYLEIWNFISCKRDITGTIKQASITLEGSQAITRGILSHGA